MNSLIVLTVIILTLPLYYDDGSLIPSDASLIATIWRTDDINPINVGLGFPGEQITINTLQTYGSWYATAWTINGKQSLPSTTVSKTKPVCGSYCH